MKKIFKKFKNLNNFQEFIGSSVCIDPKTVNPTVVEKFQKLQPLINKTLIDNKEQLKGKCETVRNQCQTIIRNNFACIDAAAFANQMSQYCIEITKA